MFREIEKIYKDGSIYNKKCREVLIYIIIFYSILYCAFCLVSCVFSLSKFLYLIEVTIMLFFTLAAGIASVLNIFEIRLFHVKEDKNKIAKDIAKMDKLLIEKYLKDRKICNKSTLLYICEHYRSSIRKKPSTFNILTIVSFVLSVVPLILKEPNVAVYTLLILLIVGLFWWILCQFKFLVSAFKGEEQMQERLYEIGSDLYVEIVSSKTKNK